MLARLQTLSERLQGSLFFVPMTFIAVGVALGLLGVEADARITADDIALPFTLTSTVDSARTVLGVVASATISFAGIAFSISLLVIQLASSQYSPRIVHGLLSDKLTKRTMGIVLGTFTYCLMVMRSVRGPLEDDGQAVIPNLSVGVGVLLGVISILSIVAFIDHSARSMDISRILYRATNDAMASTRELWTETGPHLDQEPTLPEPPADHLVVDLDTDGWIQQLVLDSLCLAVEPGGTVRLDTEVGRYAIAGTPLCVLWPVPQDREAAIERARGAVTTGTSRTTEQDVAYGVRQLADVALRALSPGVNDPTTAQDALFHMGSVLREVLVRVPPPVVMSMPDDRVLLRPQRTGHVDLINLGFNEVRIAAIGLPTVCIYVLEVLHLLAQVVGDGDPQAQAALRRQAALVRSDAERGDSNAHDADRIRDAHDRRFGSPDDAGVSEVRAR